jgi:hypothetical protein
VNQSAPNIAVTSPNYKLNWYIYLIFDSKIIIFLWDYFTIYGLPLYDLILFVRGWVNQGETNGQGLCSWWLNGLGCCRWRVLCFCRLSREFRDICDGWEAIIRTSFEYGINGWISRCRFIQYYLYLFRFIY